MTNQQKPNILAFMPGVWRWPDVCGSTRYLLWELAKLGWNVTAVEPPASLNYKTIFWEAKDRPFKVIKLGSVLPFGVSKSIQGLANFHRNKTSEAMWRKARDLWNKEPNSKGIVWLGAPWHSLLAKKAKSEGFKTVHHVYDELAASNYLRPHQQIALKKWEKELINFSDLLFCSSKPQFDKREPIHQHVSLMENAVSDHFYDLCQQDDYQPNDMELLTKISKLPKPRFVYGGVVDHRCDGKYFENIVKDDRCGSLIFLGNKGVNIDLVLSNLIKNNPKVVTTGHIPYEDYPALYREADVLVLGHHLNEFTDVMLPEKLIEYLCTGKPILSVPLPEVIRFNKKSSTKNAVYLAENEEELSMEIEHVLNDSSVPLALTRKQIAIENTWSIRGKLLDKKLTELVN